VDVLTQLAALVRADVPQARSLDGLLSAAANALNNNRGTTAVNQLRAFQKQVRFQVGLRNRALANTLIAQAQDIIDAINE